MEGISSTLCVSLFLQAALLPSLFSVQACWYQGSQEGSSGHEAQCLEWELFGNPGWGVFFAVPVASGEDLYVSVCQLVRLLVESQGPGFRLG